MSDEEIMHDDIDDGKSMKLSRYDVDPQYNDPDPNYHPITQDVPFDVTPPQNLPDAKPLKLTDMQRIFDLIQAERTKQDAKWGQQNHESRSWMLIAVEEVGEVAHAILEEDFQNYIVELVQTTAVLTAWLENELRKLNAKGISIEDIFHKHD